jgi:mobilization protein NikA
MDDETQVRPRPNEPMNAVLYVRVRPGERSLIAAAAEDSSMTISSWIRQQALRTAGISRPTRPFQPPAASHSTVKLCHQLTGRFTAVEFEAIVEHARACGLTSSELIRELVLGHEPMVRQSCVRSAIAAVHWAGGTLRQFLDLAGTGTALRPDLVRAVTELRGEIHALRDALLRADAADPLNPTK